MKEFKKDVMIKERLTIKIDEDLLKEAIRVKWESLYFSDGDVLAVAILGNKKITIDVCGEVKILKNNEFLDLDEIKQLIDDGINLWECDDIEILDNNWFSINCYIHKSNYRGINDVWVRIDDDVMESEFENIDEIIEYLTSTFEDEEYMQRFNDYK